MNKYLMFVLVFFIAYFIGNISPAIILGNLKGVDIRKEGSGNAGTTNVLRVLGAGPAAITLICDIIKGLIAVKIGFILGGGNGAIAGMIAFAAVILGHVFPALYKFKGGKGVATGLGGALALDWPSAFVAIILFLLGVGSTKKVSVGSLLAAICYPFLVFFYAREFLPVAIPLALFLVYKHIPNIKRLKAGEEPNIDFKGKFKITEKLDKVFYDPTETDDAEPNVDASDMASDVMVDMAADVEEDVVEDAAIEDGAVGEVDVEDVVEEGVATEDVVVEDVTVENSDNIGDASEESKEEEPVDFFKDATVPKLSKKNKKSVVVIGNGSFGTAMANIVAHNGHDVTLYGRKPDVIKEMAETHENKKYLPGALLSDSIHFTSDIKEAVTDKNVIIFAVPAQQFRSVAKSCVEYINKRPIFVNLAKGIEQNTHKRMSEIAAEILPGKKYVALSGPSHAEELVRNHPASVVVASENIENANKVQAILSNDRFRVYTDRDVKGVEIGGSLKNVYAIATGISDGMGYGVNAKAALMTRAIHELSKFGVSIGADQRTFSGLSGIGDLMVTCDSDLSRNRRFGKMIGSGMSSEEAINSIGSVVEGFYTTSAAVELADAYGVDCPIVKATAAILNDEITPDEAMNGLMNREQKEEKE